MHGTAALTGRGEAAYSRPSQALAVAFAAMLPAVQMAYAMLVAPLLFAAETRAILESFGDATYGPSTQAAAIVYPVIFALSAVTFLIARPSLTREARQLFAALAAICLFAFLSALWSLDPSRTIMKSAQQTMMCLSLIAAVVSARDPVRILRWVVWLMVAVVAANMLSVISRPPGPIGHEGIYAHKNHLGAAMVLAMMFGFYALSLRRLAYLLAGLFLIVGPMLLLVASESKTSLGMALLAPSLAVCFYVLAKTFRVPLLVSWLVGQIVVVCAFLVLSAVFRFQLSDLLLLLFGDETFTGRTHIWAFSAQQIAERPLLGYGYHGFWNIGPDSPRFTAHIQFIHNMPSGHNGIVDLLINLGLVGLALFAVVFGLAAGRLMRLESYGPALCILGLASMTNISLRAYMESEWFIDMASPSETMLLLFGFCAALAPAVRRRRQP